MRSSRLIIGCGYLGRRAARRWVAQGDLVFALTRSEANAADLRAVGVTPLLGDVLDPASLRSLPKTDMMLYAVGLDRKSGRSQQEVYVDGLGSVLSALSASRPRIIYISSTSVYGQSAGEWVDEASECNPISPGGKVCLAAEELLRREAPEAQILRLAGIYGPGRLIARIDQLRSGSPLSGNPEAWLNLIHVEDAVSTVIAADRRGPAGSTWLVSDDRPSLRREYYDLLAWLVGAPAPRFADSASPADRELNKRCRNRRLREALHVELRFPSIALGLPDAVMPVGAAVA